MRIKTKLSVLYFLLFFSNCFLHAKSEVIELLQNGVSNAIVAKYYQEFHDKEIDCIGKVTNPTMIVFVPNNPNGTSVLTCPDGGYQFLAITK